jgi:hypothetical protein
MKFIKVIRLQTSIRQIELSSIKFSFQSFHLATILYNYEFMTGSIRSLLQELTRKPKLV